MLSGVFLDLSSVPVAVHYNLLFHQHISVSEGLYTISRCSSSSVWFKRFCGSSYCCTTNIYFSSAAQRDYQGWKSILQLDLNCMWTHTAPLISSSTWSSLHLWFPLLSVIIACEIWAFREIGVSQHPELNFNDKKVHTVNCTLHSCPKQDVPFCAVSYISPEHLIPSAEHLDGSILWYENHHQLSVRRRIKMAHKDKPLYELSERSYPEN